MRYRAPPPLCFGVANCSERWVPPECVAIAYCKKQGWDYVVQEPNLPDKRRAKRFNSYGDNFSHLRSGIPEGGLKSEVLGDVPVVGAAKPAKKTKAKKKT